MRIAHVMAGSPQGGAELFFERLVSAQSARPELSVVAVMRREAARAARLNAAGVAPLELPFGGALDLRTRPALRRALRQFRPDIAIAWMSRAACMLPQGDWISAARLGGFYDLNRYRRCGHLIGNTRGLVRWMVAEGRAPETTHYVPNFAYDAAGARAAVLPGASAPGRTVLALGRLHRNKAFDVLVRAMAHVPDAKLVIAGEGGEREALEALIQEERLGDRVHLLGWRSDSAALLAACDVLCCPSRHEPLGNVVIEAFSAGRPVVACDADGPVELIEPGVSGLLAAREDARDLAASLSSVLEDRAMALRLAEGGRAVYDAQFSEAVVLQRWDDCLSAIQAAR